MMMKHPATGVGSAMQPALGAKSPLGDLPAFFANDNAALLVRPPRGCVGLVLSREEDASGISHITIRLLLTTGLDDHPLMVTQDARSIIALWQGMGKDFNIPLYLRDEAGTLLCVRKDFAETGYPRRYGSPLSGRRPRFLMRRKMPLKPFTTLAAL
jgi:hypothetical protein